MSSNPNEKFQPITAMLGLLTPQKVELAFDSVSIVLKGGGGKDQKLRLLVTGDEFDPMLNEKSLLVSMVQGSTLWTTEEAKSRGNYSSFMLADNAQEASAPSSLEDGKDNVNDSQETSLTVGVEATAKASRNRESEVVDETMSSTDFLLKNRKKTTSSAAAERNLRAFKSGGKKETTSFIINKKGQ